MLRLISIFTGTAAALGTLAARLNNTILIIMYYDFFADKVDKLNILKFIFEETDLHIYDADSPRGQEICEYKTADEISSKFDLSNGDKFAVTFRLWTPRMKGKLLFRKVDLNPKYCDGHTFRYSTGGLGVIHLYFGGVKNNELNRSTLSSLTESKAMKDLNATSFIDIVNEWDWAEVTKTSKQLQNHIHNKIAIRKIGGFGVLPGAHELETCGIKLR